VCHKREQAGTRRLVGEAGFDCVHA